MAQTQIPSTTLDNRIVERRVKAMATSLVGALIFLAVVVIWNLEFTYTIFFSRQPTITGWAINALTLILLLSSCTVMTRLAVRYYTENAEIKRYLTAISRTGELMRDAKSNNILGTRVALLESLARQNQSFDHGAIASILLSEEASLFQYSRFVNGILILIGVLGTVISLSIALVGASDLVLITSQNNEPIDLMMHGMSTALSTTALAIAAYVLHSYMLSSVKGIQIGYLSYLEETTLHVLIPAFRARFSMVNAPDEASSLSDMTLSEILNQLHRLNVSNQRIQELLYAGFRLPDKEK